MAIVYLAQDLRHHRPVALKVLRPELAAALGADRFLREIEIAARLTHPHILPLYDSGEAAGFLYYVMPYVEGKSLRERLSRERQLPIEDALQIAREVADALSYSHSHDVIHRDIKPENVLLEAGHAVVSDFGIARAISAAGGERLTKTGVALGTPAYMSPEQAAGEPQLDGRTDLYGLGCVLYEMLAGQPPFTGVTVESVVRQHLTADVPVVTAIRPAVPDHVARALRRALAKTPADRFTTVAQFAEAIFVPAGRAPTRSRSRWLGGGLALAALALVGVAVLFVRPRPAPLLSATPPERTVAVLPFRTVGQGLDLWREGLVDLLATNLDNVGGLRAIDSRTVLSQWRRRAVVESGETALATALEVARETGAGFGVVGSVVGLGPNVRLTARLYPVDNSEPAGEAQVEGPQDSVLSLVDALSVEVLKYVLGAAPTRRMRLSSITTSSLDALRAFLEGEQRYRRSDFRGAIEAYRRAVAIDSSFALALYGLASSYGWTVVIGAPEALEFGERAVAHADRLPERERLVLRGGLLLEAGRPAAMDTLQLAAARYPDDADAWYHLGDAYFHLGLVRNIPGERAREAFDRAIALDSTFAPAVIHNVALAFGADESAGARRYVEQYTALDSSSTVAVGVRAALDLAWGSATDSAAARRRLAADPDAIRQAIVNGLGWRAEGGALLRELTGELRHPGVPEALRAFSYTGYFIRAAARGWVREGLAGLREGYRRLDRPEQRAFTLVLSVAGYVPPEEVRQDEEAARQDTMDISLWALGVLEARKRSPASEQYARRLRDRAAKLRAAGDTFAAERAEGLAEGLQALVAGFAGNTRRAVPILRDAVERIGGGPFAIGVISDVHRLYLASWLAEEPNGVDAALEILNAGALLPFQARFHQLAAATYERQGQRSEAAAHYARLIELWRDADPELQPVVADARAALQRLAAEPQR